MAGEYVLDGSMSTARRDELVIDHLVRTLRTVPVDRPRTSRAAMTGDGLSVETQIQKAGSPLLIGLAKF